MKRRGKQSNILEFWFKTRVAWKCKCGAWKMKYKKCEKNIIIHKIKCSLIPDANMDSIRDKSKNAMRKCMHARTNASKCPIFNNRTPMPQFHLRLKWDGPKKMAEKKKLPLYAIGDNYKIRFKHFEKWTTSLEIRIIFQRIIYLRKKIEMKRDTQHVTVSWSGSQEFCPIPGGGKLAVGLNLRRLNAHSFTANLNPAGEPQPRI